MNWPTAKTARNSPASEGPALKKVARLLPAVFQGWRGPKLRLLPPWGFIVVIELVGLAVGGLAAMLIFAVYFALLYAYNRKFGHAYDRDMLISVSEDKHIHEVYNALAKALQALEPRDLERLDSRQRRDLCRILSACAAPEALFYSPRLALAILPVLEQIGDASALDCLMPILRETDTSPAQQRVQAAARQCRRAIEERLEREREGRTLLRPAAPPEADTLLRPAQGPGASDSTTLLRPVEQEEEQALVRHDQDG